MKIKSKWGLDIETYVGSSSLLWAALLCVILIIFVKTTQSIKYHSEVNIQEDSVSTNSKSSTAPIHICRWSRCSSAEERLELISIHIPLIIWRSLKCALHIRWTWSNNDPHFKTTADWDRQQTEPRFWPNYSHINYAYKYVLLKFHMKIMCHYSSKVQQERAKAQNDKKKN